jgi:ring-1,2-phenylacetyl-CoA epoxidase subunit PaaD
MNKEQIWQALEKVSDPEIPVVSLVEMGIVRDVEVSPDEAVNVTITPTFAGCPAMRVMQEDIVKILKEQGIKQIQVKTQLAPAWTSDWISEAGRAKLKAFGLAPPEKHGGDLNMILFNVARCPRCNSRNTRLQNSFGSTLCRAIYTCNNCKEPFEQFKAI